ncbi:MAG: LacI family DNA-binding transcriptional regulator [Candidatus Methylacidiphilales bacterium]|nr:LacI family DNA-binding transcriptional regulator [Candidatus Methylacidiphilales bacterium]
MANGPSLRDIADKTGLSVSGVSRALREDASIPQKTRDRVLKAAASLGYSPNPQVSMLMAEIHRRSPVKYRGTLAWVRMTSRWPEEPYTARCRKGAEERARTLGYTLDTFSVDDLSRTRLNVVLKARGIQGVLVAPLPHSRYHLVLDWNAFAGVAIGNSLRRPLLSRVVNHQYHSVQVALREMRRRGYQRLALCLNRENSARTDHNWLAGALVHRHLLGAEVSVMLMRQWDKARNGILSWLRRTRIQAVLSPHAPFLEFLRQGGLNIPNEMGFACLDLSPENTSAGIDQRHDQVGQIAADMLIGQILRRESAVHTRPVATLVEGSWKDGDTLPRRRMER